VIQRIQKRQRAHRETRVVEVGAAFTARETAVRLPEAKDKINVPRGPLWIEASQLARKTLGQP
jgi:hypothetical protein